MDILQTIMTERRAAVAACRADVPRSRLERLAADRVHHSLRERLVRHTGTQVIAELKKASPSAGLLRPDYDPGAIARRYADAGAAALSVLTEPRHFLGSPDHLRAVRAAVDLPILRKDFMCDDYQVMEAAAWGADVILLIVAALDDAELRGLYQAALAQGLEVLVESHTAVELERALALDAAIIGVNSRDLKTLTTNLDVARQLAESIPPARLAIAESGIQHRADIEDLEGRGYRGFLIGEALVRASDPGGRLAELLAR
jgi:indole-3-glycerol phosphate synthase